MRETIREFDGRIIGYMDYESNGNIVVRDFYGKILGKYDKSQDVTMDAGGRILFRGNMAGSLIGMYGNK